MSVATPVGFLIAATVVLVVGDGRSAEAAAYTLYGCAVLMAIGSLIFRAGLSSTADRDREEAARVFFDQHGRWPRRDEL